MKTPFRFFPARRALGLLVALSAALFFLAWLGPQAGAQAPEVVAPAAPGGGVAPAPLPAAGEAAGTGAGDIPTNLLEMMRAGGFLMWPIAFCSFVLFIFVIERAISLRRSRVIPGPFVKRFLSQLKSGQIDREQALGLCEGNQSPVAEVFAAAVKKWGKASVEIEQAIIDSGERVTQQLRKYSRVFNVIHTISPLLGLLGTVVGMIQCFNEVSTSNAMGRPHQLAGGISTALLTTAFGLVVAIPALLAYSYFISRVDRLVLDIDQMGQQVVNSIASDGWREPAPRSAKGGTRPKPARSVAAGGADEDEEE